MSQDWKSPELDDLFDTILLLNTKEDLASFFRDVATIKELDEMAARWKAVQLVDAGESYRAITKETGLSSATVTRVAYWLRYGEGGYRKGIEMKKSQHHHAQTGR